MFLSHSIKLGYIPGIDDADIMLNLSGKRNLLEYEIQDWKIFLDNTGEMSRAEVKIVFRR